MNDRNYNYLFEELQKYCDEENCFNAFQCITFPELKELNYLLDRLIVFCENVDQEELEDEECGDKVLNLYRLADVLFQKAYEYDCCQYDADQRGCAGSDNYKKAELPEP